ncbi:hypothetical protein [Streptomyces rubiginosohelvolus]|uniref:hypothetical protein n=1 Tax=Streptomyces rubiginosohelvolus TaxID=67362 RepID=UPI0036880FD5
MFFLVRIDDFPGFGQGKGVRDGFGDEAGRSPECLSGLINSRRWAPTSMSRAVVVA